MSHTEHQEAARQRSVGFAVLTLSDTRTRENDTSGQLIRETMLGQGHRLITDGLIRDEPAELAGVLETWLADEGIDVILTNGGTGLSRRDQTIDVLENRLEKRVPGFGELFRMLSYQEIGAAAMLSRAVGGVIHGKVVFALPGSTSAVRLAMEKLIVPQIRHIVGELRK